MVPVTPVKRMLKSLWFSRSPNIILFEVRTLLHSMRNVAYITTNTATSNMPLRAIKPRCVAAVGTELNLTNTAMNMARLSRRTTIIGHRDVAPAFGPILSRTNRDVSK
jgi:hypothetical protein